MRNSRILAAVMAAGLAFSPGMAAANAAPVPRAIVGKKSKKSLFSGQFYHSGFAYSYPRPGMSMAQQKRVSKKTRNVKRHRAACRR